MKVKILTEAGRQIGLGHLTRCSALYDEVVRREVEAELLVYGDLSASDYFDNHHVTSCDWLKLDFIEENIDQEDYVIVDSYLADRQIYEAIARRARRAVYIDDTNRIQYPKGVVINPSLNGCQVPYPKTDGQTILAGPEYVLLRKAFSVKKKVKKSDRVGRVLIMMGGTDVKNVTSTLINMLAKKNEELVFDVVVSQTKFQYFTKKLPFRNVNYLTNLDEEAMAKKMSKADIAISAAGQTLHELISLKVPFLAVQVIGNQKNNLRAVSDLISDEMTVDSTDSDFVDKIVKRFSFMMDKHFRNKLIANMDGLIDGLGAQRIINVLLGDDLLIRKAERKDIQAVFELSNQDAVRKYSINKAKISWDTHVEWFNKVLDSEAVTLYIITNSANELLGQIRFNFEAEHAVISISFGEGLRGKGLAARITSACIDKVFSEKTDLGEIIAYVSEKNIPSVKLFMRLNFKQDGFEDNMMRFIIRKGVYNDTR